MQLALQLWLSVDKIRRGRSSWNSPNRAHGDCLVCAGIDQKNGREAAMVQSASRSSAVDKEGSDRVPIDQVPLSLLARYFAYVSNRGPPPLSVQGGCIKANCPPTSSSGIKSLTMFPPVRSRCAACWEVCSEPYPIPLIRVSNIFTFVLNISDFATAIETKRITVHYLPAGYLLSRRCWGACNK